MCVFEEGEQVKMMLVVVLVFVWDVGLRSWKRMVGGVGLRLRGWEEVGEGFWRRRGEGGGGGLRVGRVCFFGVVVGGFLFLCVGRGW